MLSLLSAFLLRSYHMIQNLCVDWLDNHVTIVLPTSTTVIHGCLMLIISDQRAFQIEIIITRDVYWLTYNNPHQY